MVDRDDYLDMGTTGGPEMDMEPSFGGESVGVKELASLSLSIQSKKFYLDVKENMSGRFIKIAEINVSGIKNKVIFDMTAAHTLLEYLVEFADFYVALGPQPAVGGRGGSRGVAGGSGGGGGPISQPLKSESFKRLAFNRIYHMDLAQNEKGVFLKLSCANQSGGRQGKQTVVFPAQGIVELRDKLKMLVDEFYVEEVEMVLPQSKKFSYGSRLLFLDVGYTNRGYYLKMSEVSKNPAINYRRQTIHIPRKLWPNVMESLEQLHKETSELQTPSTSAPLVPGYQSYPLQGSSSSGGPLTPSSPCDVTDPLSQKLPSLSLSSQVSPTDNQGDATSQEPPAELQISGYPDHPSSGQQEESASGGSRNVPRGSTGPPGKQKKRPSGGGQKFSQK